MAKKITIHVGHLLLRFVLLSDLFEALSELIILTASSCLHGKEIRGLLDEHVAQLYADLDGGFSHAAWLLPGWLPLPSFRWDHDIVGGIITGIPWCWAVFSFSEARLAIKECFPECVCHLLHRDSPIHIF